MIGKVLVANRGEIAVRIIKACREMGITSAAVYSEADKNSLHVRLADEAYNIGAAPASESYLNYPAIIETALKVKADAIHPGYGFLSENEDFIEDVEKAGITFIGPMSSSVRMMGDKASARSLMHKAGVPVVPGTLKALPTLEEAARAAKEIGYPVLLKASAGGGGKGMRLVRAESELEASWDAARRESMKAFASDEIYIEKYIENPKHIEVQVIADKLGNYAHLFERECSIQRRHQKIIEEAPSSFVDAELRMALTQAAIEAARACNYYNAGTIEFLVGRDRKFYFLEMNTRLQVEHPVTEMITGIDIVKEQIRIADGQRLSFTQDDVQKRGHALECRIYAEDTDNNFVPSTGEIKLHRRPDGIGIRVDTGIDPYSNVSVYYDPLLTKIVSWGNDRNEAIARMQRALSEYKISGVLTNIAACRWILGQQAFLDGSFDITFVDERFLPLVSEGTWKQQDTQELEAVAGIMAALLKNKINEVNPKALSCSANNKWRSKLYE